MAEWLKSIQNSSYLSHFTEKKGSLTGELRWNGILISVEIDISPDVEEMQLNISVAEELLSAATLWKSRLDEHLLRSLLGQTWIESEGAQLAPDELLSKVKLLEVVIEEGEFSFWHSDGGLYYGHSIVVHGNIADGIKMVMAPM